MGNYLHTPHPFWSKLNLKGTTWDIKTVSPSPLDSTVGLYKIL